MKKAVYLPTDNGMILIITSTAIRKYIDKKYPSLQFLCYKHNNSTTELYTTKITKENYENMQELLKNLRIEILLKRIPISGAFLFDVNLLNSWVQGLKKEFE